ncbi:MAG TPA: flagellar basal-body MS-ring/collar protein FliF, partial [Burkholderiaceae bacterium]|nr:flagellar basal-body MS-ring/collar protein FliF [Burkholderiaceae bacterium]
LLTLHGGRTLDRAQVAGIVHLVASSVPELSPRQVSVIDQTGALLSQQGDQMAPGGLDPGQLQYVRSIEQAYVNRILEIVEPIVGRGNVRAQVTADVDFTLSESTAEQFRPNQGNEPAAIRSQQTMEAPQPAGAGAQGVPGALSNQPPAPATAPLLGAAQPLPRAAGPAGAAAGPQPVPTRREAVTNYEVDKTVRVTRNASGNIKRLAAAVVINHRRSVDEEGKPTLTPMDIKEIEQIQALVREAIGFTRDRGDSLNVVNAPFTLEEPAKPEPVPMWRQPEVQSLARSIGGQLVLVLLGLLAIFGVIRPAVKSAAAARRPLASAVVGNDVALPPPGSPAALAAPARAEDVMRLARENPATVANVVRTWVNN